jgi:hypothetical protein
LGLHHNGFRHHPVAAVQFNSGLKVKIVGNAL